MKRREVWWSPQLNQDICWTRWGHYGRPVLLFPTAGGDAEEIERFLMIDALRGLIDAGRIKVYSLDSVAGRVWTDGHSSGGHRAWVQSQFDAFVYELLVPAIREDCQSPDLDIVTAGASIGAFNALAAICRHPDVFSHAICMSGTYDLSKWCGGEHTLDLHYSSPIQFVPGLDERGDHLRRLRERFVLLATGQGRWEDPGESWHVAHILGERKIPNRVDLWGHEWDHDWVTWRDMLPKYLGAIA